MNDFHIVVIEDDLDMLNLISGSLTRAGHRVTCLRAVESLEALVSLNADCFVLEEALPIVSGHIICIYLRSKSETRNKPLLLMSAHPDLEKFAGLCQANDWLEKPYDEVKLLDKVNSLLSIADLEDNN